jgi:hypothetical protein
MMAPKRKFIFNKKTKQMGKILIDTWEARLTMEKEGLVISMKQDIEGNNRRITHISSIVFHKKQCILSSKTDAITIDDKGSVGCLRKKIKSMRHEINLDRIVIGTTVIYHSHEGKESIAHSIISSVAADKDNKGTIGWKRALYELGIHISSPDGDFSEDNYMQDLQYKNAKESENIIDRKRKLRRKRKKKDKSKGKESNEKEVPDSPTKAKHKPKPAKIIKIKNWRLAHLNIHDLRKHTAKKFKGLAEMMVAHNLHGIALGEMRVEDASLFTLHQHKYKGLTLLVNPCLTKNTIGVEGGLSGNAGGLGFLIKTELLDQGLFSNMESIQSTGFYGKEDICYINIKVGTSKIKWVNTYVRSRGGSEEKCYEWDKIKTLMKIKGDKIIMGDINGSIVYSRPTELWKKEGLGFSTPQSNATIKRTGTRLRSEITEAEMTDISAIGKFIWTPTRCPVGGPNNKLDTVIVSNTLENKARGHNNSNSRIRKQHN